MDDGDEYTTLQWHEGPAGPLRAWRYCPSPSTFHSNGHTAKRPAIVQRCDGRADSSLRGAMGLVSCRNISILLSSTFRLMLFPSPHASLPHRICLVNPYASPPEQVAAHFLIDLALNLRCSFCLTRETQLRAPFRPSCPREQGLSEPRQG